MSAGTLPPLQRKVSRRASGTGSGSKLRLERIDFESEVNARVARCHGRPLPITFDELVKPKPTFEEIHRSMAGMDISRFGKNAFETTCLEILEEGCHRAFKELFSINEQQKADREAAGKDSGYYYDPMIIDSDEKLEHLKTFLIAAEVGQRRGNYEQVYSSQLQLAQYFDETQDEWLSDRFYQLCLSSAKLITCDNQQKEGEANANIGLALESRGRFHEAARHFETFYNLASTADPAWYTVNGENMVKTSAGHLCRIYTTIAEEIFDDDSDAGIAYLQKSLDRARKVDSQTEGLAHYRLGNVFQTVGKYEKALEHHRAYLEKSRHTQDDHGIAGACEGLACVYESMERWDDTIQYLEMLAEVAKRCSDQDMMSRALSKLGSTKNMLGRFEEAVSDLDRCFNIQVSEMMVQVEEASVNTSRVQYSICKAHACLERMSNRIVSACQTGDEGHALDGLIGWKDLRMVEQQVLSAEEVPGSAKEVPGLAETASIAEEMQEVANAEEAVSSSPPENEQLNPVNEDGSTT